jgi:DNA modification methylase
MQNQNYAHVTGHHHSPLGTSKFRLFHADALTDMGQILGQEKAVGVVTDLPYDEINDRPTNGIRDWGVGAMDQADFQIPEAAQLLYSIPSAWAIVFCGWRQFSPLVEAFQDLNASVRYLPLVKTNPSPATSQKGIASNEICVVASKPGAPRYGKGVLTDLRCGSPRLRVNGIRALKSPRLMAHLIRHVTRPGDLVVDPFMGVGTTGEAALQLGRHFLGVDRDQAIYSAAVSHIQGLRVVRNAAELEVRYRPLS